MKHFVCLVLCAPFFTLSLPADAQIVRQDPNYGDHVIPPTNTASFKDLIGTGAAIFFGGDGEVPVRDVTVRISTAAMLVDMLRQALGGSGPENETTQRLSREITELSEDPFAQTYGSYDEVTWNDTHPLGDHVFPDGGYLLNDLDRGMRAITTYRNLMRMLQARKDALRADQERARDIYDAIADCAGRNCIEAASGHATTELIWQQHVTQQLTMVSANAEMTYYAHMLSEEKTRQAQERAVVTNFGVAPARPEPRDWGL